MLDLPKNFKLVITGGGRVAGGAIEVLEKTNIKRVSPEDFLSTNFGEPVYTQLDVEDYVKRDDGAFFDIPAFFKNPSGHSSNFMRYAAVADVYVACHYWDNRSPFIFSRDDVKNPDWNISLVADVSCDIDGPVASTIRPSTIENPIYGYNPKTEQEDAFDKEDVITVMAIDNLPCELPKDASEDFGNEMIKHIFPALIGYDQDDLINRASICKNGDLNAPYEYLRAYVNGN